MKLIKYTIMTILFSCIVFPILKTSFAADSGSVTSSIFINPFTLKDFRYGEYTPNLSNKNEDIGENIGENIGKDIRDYIAEAIVTYKNYSVISDDDVKNLGEEVEKQLSFGSCPQEDECAKKLMLAIDTDNIIYGTCEYHSNKMTIQAALLHREGGSVRKSIEIPRERYIDEASYALANYLITRKESYIRDFYEWMEEKEYELRRSTEKWEKTLQSIQEEYYSKLECLNHSPFLRIGYGGFLLSNHKTTYLHNKDYNEYYNRLSTYMLDVFVYRYRDEVGDGIDMYSRLFYKNFLADESAYQKIQTEMQSLPQRNYNNYAGKYSPVPEDKLTMTHIGGDIGIRFVGSTYFLWEAWSYYVILGFRYVRVEEKYFSGGEEYNKLFNSLGYTCGIGMEITLNRYVGLFGEISAGYTVIGENNINIDGLQLLVGVTFRSSIRNAFFGFF